MKRNLSPILITFLCLITLPTIGQEEFWIHDFETSGGYLISPGQEFTDNSQYFARTDGSDISGVSLSNTQGSYYFGAQVVHNDYAQDSPQTIRFEDINIVGRSNIQFSVYIAEDDASDGNNDWDKSDYVHIQYCITDDGVFTDLINIENDGSDFDSAPYIDTDFDGDGEGFEITNSFTKFTADIQGTGSVLHLRIWFNLDEDDADIAIDNLSLTSDAHSASFAISTYPQLTEGNLNGSTVTLTLYNDTFSNLLTSSNFELINAPETTSINSVTRLTDTQATIALNYDGTNFDSTITNFHIVAHANALTGDDEKRSNNLPISASAPPTVITFAPTDITNSTATLNAAISANGLATNNIVFVIDTDSTFSNPTTLQADPNTINSEDENSSVSKDITGLTTGVTHYVKAEATNSEGTTTGDTISFIPTNIPNAWINEFSPTNYASYLGLEIVIEDTASFDLANFQINLYNSDDGTSFNSITLNDASIEIGDTVNNFTFYHWRTELKCLSGGISLSYLGTVISDQFISYNGSFTANDGPAKGLTSNNIGNFSYSCGDWYSLQLEGTGSKYEDFSWEETGWNSYERLNDHQTLIESSTTAAPTVETLTATAITKTSATLNAAISANGLATNTIVFVIDTDSLFPSPTTIAANPDTLNSDAEYSLVSAEISGLTTGVTLYFRAEATNSEGTTIGDTLSFIPLEIPNAWINEFHYDDTFGGRNEGIEIVIENADTYTLSNFQIDLYNGADGTSYASISVDSTDITTGSTVNGYTFYYWSKDIQNETGGISLSYLGTTIPGQFISYEGSFIATDGPATGTISTDNGNSENGNSAYIDTHSIQLHGTGTKYTELIWLRDHYSINEININQRLGDVPLTATWKRGSNDLWFDCDNWEGDTIPGKTTNVTIPKVSCQPTINGKATINNLTVNSNATILEISNLTINGTVTIKRDLSEDKWQYITPPVSNATANAIEMETEGENAYLVTYNNDVPGSGSDLQQGWEYITSDATALSPGTGYGVFVDAAKEISFTGTLVTGNQTISGITAGDEGNNPWVLVGNSALAHIDWTKVSPDDDITSSAYFYDATNSRYATITHAGAMTNTTTAQIPPMQGFFVEVDNSGDGKLILPDSAQTHGDQTFYKSVAINTQIRLAIQKSNYSDETLIYFDTGASNGYESSLDAHKLMASNPGLPQLYSLSEDHKLAINALNQYPAIIPLNIHSTVNESLTLKVLELEYFENDLKILLEDRLLGITYDLAETDKIEFNAIAGENEDRFVMHFTNTTSVNEIKHTFRVYSKNKVVVVKSSLEINGEINLFDLSGRAIYHSEINGNYKEITVQKAGIYIVTITNGSQLNHFKVCIQ